jgi:carboxy-cis,cis-muconate cyclase
MRFHQTATGLLAGAVTAVHAAKHQLFTGTYSNYVIYTLEYDDEAQTLSMIQNNTTPTASQWLTLSHDKKSLYGTSTTATQTEFVSYTVGDDGSLTHDTTTVAGSCVAKTIHVEASPVEPYGVYGVPWYGEDNNCGGAMDVNDATSTIVGAVQNYTYAEGSACHGLSVHPTGDYIYTADLDGNKIWTHAIDRTTGALTVVGSEAAANGPRHVWAHPNGGYAYALLQTSNEVSLYKIDNSTGLATSANVTYSIVPSEDTGSYWGATVRIDATASSLYATTRGSGTAPGYLSGFTLNEDGSIASQDFIIHTSTGGGGANQVAPSPFDDNIFVMVDNEIGFIEIWKRYDNKTGAEALVRATLQDGGCCSNAVWYS